MKNFVCKTLQLFLSLAIVISLASIISAQDSSCNTRYTFVGAAISGEWEQIFDGYCRSTKTQYEYQGIPQSMHVIATNAARTPDGQVHTTIGGKTSCSPVAKEIIITFSEPVADLVLLVEGALTATDNRGYSVSFDSPSTFEIRPNLWWFARFPGTGITQVTVTNPVQWKWINSPEGELFWLMSADWGYFTPESLYKKCNCEAPTVQTPPIQNISSTWPFDLDGVDPNWSMKAEVSEKDGLVLRDVMLGQRYMAERMSVPYYYLQTSLMPNTKGELKPDSSDPSMRSRLVDFNVWADDEKLAIEAKYSISEIPAGTQSCLQITQRYEFYKSKPGDHCEPSGTLPCSRWKPTISYKFFGRNADTLSYITIPQRQRLTVHGNPNNSVGIFRDCENSPYMAGCADGLLISKRANPLHGEWFTRVISNGKSTQEWDNFHLTDRGVVDEPGVGFNLEQMTLARAGCPECLHNHWRWSAASGGEDNGNPIGLAKNSHQDLDVAVFRYNSGEEHPTWFMNLHNNEKIRTWFPSGRDPLQVYRDSAPDAPVLWYSAGSNGVEDSFFSHSHFYNPALPSNQLYNGSTSTPFTTDAAQQTTRGAVQAALMTGVDGISSIVSSEIFVAGTTNVAAFNASLGGTLPAGYTQYSALSYDVTTTAELSGPNTITFAVPSVTDQTKFNNLRVFHLEADPYSPGEIKWVDRTVLSPDPAAPDFVNKTINAKANTLGQFVMAALTQPQPPNTATADIRVTINDSPDGVVVANNLTYTVTVANIGPQAANDVVFNSSLPTDSTFISVNSAQGNCSHEEGSVVCKLNGIASGANAVITMVVRPTETGIPVPAQGRTITITSSARAVETDLNTNNNFVSENTTVLPDGNQAPSVNIGSPSAGSLFVGPANILIDTVATDSDGSVSKVEFFGDGTLLGTGTFITQSRYSFAWNNV
ncbi:MAG TPA: Ig-like domain-containing protein, partial [Pyrinomonadaceae bacterium]|nr:Ig-like domain-containing protein [Pyrinomonadaceae bacterium]